MLLIQGASALTAPLQTLASNPLQLNAALAVLQAYSLVTRHPETHTLDIHRLVQVVLRQAMPKEVERAWVERVVRAINLLFPWPEAANWEACRQLLPHVQACAVLIEDWQVALLEGADLLHNVGWYLKNRSEYDEAQRYSEQALAIRRTVLGEQHLDTARSLNNLANVYYDQGKYSEAEAVHHQALAIKRVVVGEQHPDTALSLNNLGELYCMQGKNADALPLFERALAILQKKLGPEHPHTKNAQYNVEQTLQAMKREAGAPGMDAEQP